METRGGCSFLPNLLPFLSQGLHILYSDSNRSVSHVIVSFEYLRTSCWQPLEEFKIVHTSTTVCYTVTQGRELHLQHTGMPVQEILQWLSPDLSGLTQPQFPYSPGYRFCEMLRETSDHHSHLGFPNLQLCFHNCFRRGTQRRPAVYWSLRLPSSQRDMPLPFIFKMSLSGSYDCISS